MDKKGSSSAIIVFLLLCWFGMFALVHLTGNSFIEDTNSEYSPGLITTWTTMTKIITWQVDSSFWFVSLLTDFLLVLTGITIILVLRGI